MELKLEREVAGLKRQLIEIGSRAEGALHNAIESIRKRNPDLADRVFATEEEINEMEVQIEEETLKIIALKQPVAADLRFLISVLKINKDIERIDDLSVNIAENALEFSRLPELEVPINFNLMGDETKSMVRMSLDALVNLDSHMAREVCTADDRVDELNLEIYHVCRKALKDSPQHVDALLLMLSASRQLERIADHATNISKVVLYMVEGEIVRHRKDQYLLNR